MTTYKSIHSTSLLVMLKPRTFFTRYINQTRELITISVKPSILAKEDLQ